MSFLSHFVYQKKEGLNINAQPLFQYKHQPLLLAGCSPAEPASSLG